MPKTKRVKSPSIKVVDVNSPQKGARKISRLVLENIRSRKTDFFSMLLQDYGDPVDPADTSMPPLAEQYEISLGMLLALTEIREQYYENWINRLKEHVSSPNSSAFKVIDQQVGADRKFLSKLKRELTRIGGDSTWEST